MGCLLWFIRTIIVHFFTKILKCKSTGNMKILLKLSVGFFKSCYSSDMSVSSG
jgi:hypothetical protein